ncbi:uncharacterized protein BROUX77_005627 [Berkeleyomyces rouxiae]|uniref:uncharacterized protein n=1 Tax=Berkeleyomyces rouxiae TaxID=2035830 RepID=UPI003B82B068
MSPARNTGFQGPPLRILSLDGGGVRSLSSLLVLERIMEDLGKAKGLDKPPKPCEYFDLIGGTSTGGLIAIMLGRLGMTVGDCIQTYTNFVKAAFTPRTMNSEKVSKMASLLRPSKGIFSTESLESAIKLMIRENCAHPGCVKERKQRPTTFTCSHEDMKFRDKSCTKTVVLASTKENLDTLPSLFKTYDTSKAFEECSIWQVAQAVSSTAVFFEPTRIGRDGIEFVDSGLGYNNPCDIIMEEAHNQFPERTEMQILSIGTGIGNAISIGDSKTSIMKALIHVVTSSTEVELRLGREFRDGKAYHRFNVDYGLEGISLFNWKDLSKVSALTQRYLQENKQKVQRCISVFAEQPLVELDAQTVHVPRVELASRTSIRVEIDSRTGQEHYVELDPQTGHEYYVELDSQTRRSHYVELDSGPHYTELDAQMAQQPAELEGDRPLHFIPHAQNHGFIGRTHTLRALQDMLFTQPGIQRVALVGPGGMGKTQIALRLAHWVREHRPEYSVIWTSASSMAGFEQVCRELVEELDIRYGDVQDARELVRRYLGSKKARKWLLIVDDANDASAPRHPSQESIFDFLPQSDDGRILVTTRSEQVADLAAHPNALQLPEPSINEAVALFEQRLADKTQLHDLALVLELLQQQLASLPLAIVQAAAYMNMQQVGVAEYLELLSRARGESIELLQSQAPRSRTHYPDEYQQAAATTWTVSCNRICQDFLPAAYLLLFISHLAPEAIPLSLLPDFESSSQATDALDTLIGYGFLQPRRGGEVLDMPGLVHSTTRLWAECQDNSADMQVDVLTRMTNLFAAGDWENRRVQREYLTHALGILEAADGANEGTRRLSAQVSECMLSEGSIAGSPEYSHDGTARAIRQRPGSQSVHGTPFERTSSHSSHVYV